jgi:hypothetical protein
MDDWLPKDERKVLLFLRKYYTAKVSRSDCKKVHPDPGHALNRLIERGHLKDCLMGEVALTPTGFDLANKYRSPWHRSKLWYEHYLRGNPIWVPIAVILTLILTYVGQYIYGRLFPSQ